MAEHDCGLSARMASFPALQQHRRDWQHELRTLFRDSERSNRFSVSARDCGITLDFSKNHLDDETLQLLVGCAREARLTDAVQDLLRGERVNNTEDRPALHTALRFQGKPQTAEEHAVAACREQMAAFVERVRSGAWTGFSGKAITDVVNIGIGGSDLGPRMVTEALLPREPQPVRVHFVANIDGADLADLQWQLDPETTLFIVASKSFSTLETRENALSARAWTLAGGCPENALHKHFVASTSNIPAAVEFGIAEQNIFPLWDWVGGRYSLWSAIGLPIAMACGYEVFEQLLAGAQRMDVHFASAPLEQNLPALLALITFWYAQCWGAQSQVMLPYAQRLEKLPAWLQQLDMESLGKHVTRNGKSVDYVTGVVIWGSAGTNGQHSFHQLLHQGKLLVPADFVAVRKPMSTLTRQHNWLLANCFSQSRALMEGRSAGAIEAELLAKGMAAAEAAELAQHKAVPGNRPSNTILLDELTPATLGALLALYEHKVFALGTLLGINPFDQWGVELGKLLGEEIFTAASSGELPAGWDASTRSMVEACLPPETEKSTDQA
ncbi:glucose-6-phosphate isomerase [Biformimicrobium ophioploci]|uniref:Glucose-6-phosphate isomerase n=1 Tax=Biformimicrobium ophioploci TaxID=3036711 RepID=A0ABQ6M2Q4_9GAMM|nr:glucose-6-phosphate isomerase [Microbulbifer sp. NKW57]GMG88607.1 glucose-6-phosphate isomerase [Microbulbifer sp. NKW57]